MRTRAGVILIEDNNVALIERHRAGLEYFVFPGGGVDEGESPEQGAIREAMEELGVQVGLKHKIVEINFGRTSRHIYFLVERIAGEFGTGTGEEFTDADPYDPYEGVYIPVWMPLDEVSRRTNIYPAELAKLVLKSPIEGWPEETVILFEAAT